MAEWRPIETAPRDGTPIVAWLDGRPVVIGWAQELEKRPPPFLERPVGYQPEILRVGGWRRMVLTDVFGWGFHQDFEIVAPEYWEPLPGHFEAQREKPKD